MNYYTVKPNVQLSDYVRYFWVLQGNASEHQPYIHRALANGCPELLFHYKGQFDELIGTDKSEKSFVSGIHAQASQYRRFIIKQDFGILGVYVYPYTASLLLNIPAHEMSNQLPDLFSLLGREGLELEERIMLASTDQEKIRIVSGYLESKLLGINPRQEIMQSVKAVIHTKGMVDIQKLADGCCLSIRQFERVFKEYSGFSPKLFARIIRFNATISSSEPAIASLTEIAYQFGYYDQSHFIQDFKEFSGYSPGSYFFKKAEGSNLKEL